ncbi:hypothetical protein AeMF1_010283 [Aphanomyces euteiches]|nr:hypothetical protein AeMF1_010283 [Aphanomyces euteiches]
MDDIKEKYRQEWEVLEREEKALDLEKKKLSEEWVLVEKYQQCYEKDRATFEAMVAEKFDFMPPDEVVQFNIGGKLFKSTVKVWTRDRFSILAQLCTTSPKLARDARGHFYFDRDWWIFKYIYAFLRDKTLPDSLDVLRDLYYEASYYRITLLRHAIEAFLKNHTTTDVARVHHSYIPSNDAPLRQYVPNVGEREWSSQKQSHNSPPQHHTAAPPQGKQRRQSISKGAHMDVRPPPPRVHPFRHETTTSRLDVQSAPPSSAHPHPPLYHQRGYDPALDFIDHRRHPGSYPSNRGYGDGYTDPREYGRESKYQPDRRHGQHYDRHQDDDYRRGRDYDRYDVQPRHNPVERDDCWHYDQRDASRGHYQPDQRHYHDSYASQRPLSPPLADPHGFLSRRKQYSMSDIRI